MCRSTHDLWTSLARLLPIGHLPGTAALLKTLWLFSLSSPLIPFCPLTSQTRGVFLQTARGASSTHKAQCSLEGAAGTMISPLPGGQHTGLTAPAPPAWPPRWLWQGCDAEASVLHDHRHEQGLRPPRVPLAQGELLFRRCPTELGRCWGRNSAGRGYGQGCKTVVALSLQSQQKPAGSGAWP